MQLRRSSLLRTPTVVAGLAAVAAAGFTMATAPSWRFAPETEFGGWESFIEPHLGDNPADAPAGNTGAVLVQTVPGAIITTGGNIYHPTMAPNFELRDVVDCDLQEVWLQVSTWGSLILPSSVHLEFTDCGGAQATAAAPTMTVLASYPNPQGLGTNQELLFVWNLANDTSDVREYVLYFDAASANVSLDALQLDARTDCSSPDGCDLGTVFCSGDGTGSPCPCGNTGTAGSGCANSASPDGASISASGSLSLSAADLTLHGSGLVPNQPALAFQGSNAVNGGAGSIFGDGLRCAGLNVVRLQTVVPDANGDAATTVDVGARGGVSSGDTRYYQLWYRDPLSGPCGSGFNLTNGLALTWAD